MTSSPSNNGNTIHVTKLNIHKGDVGAHVDWLARMMMVGVGDCGVISAEIIPPATHAESEWTLVQRFDKSEEADAWRSSEHRKKLLTDLQSQLNKQEVSLSEEDHSIYGTVGNVAVAIVTHVKEGHESAYCRCEHTFQSLQARQPGYRGAYIQPPTSGTAGIWTTIIRFDNADALDQWFHSEDRKKLLTESEKHVESWDYQMVNTSYPGFFPDKGGAKGPPNWKVAPLILLGLYPIVMSELKFLMPLMGGLPGPVANFIAMAISVAGTTWATMPAFIKLYSAWLFPTKHTPRWVSAASMASLVILFAIEIFIFGRS